MRLEALLSESLKKDLKEVLRKVQGQGGIVKKLPGGHFRIYPPDKTKDIVHTPSSPGDYRGLKNLISVLRKAGFDL